MSIFLYDDYKKWANDKVSSLANKGRGQWKRIADHLNTSPTIVTQVFNGDRDLTAEQAMLLGQYFNLSKIESRFLILLVNYARAASHLYKKNLYDEILEMRSLAKEIKNRVEQNKHLSDEAKAILYANWYYLAIWSLTAIPGFNNLDVIIKHLQLNQIKAREGLDFLLQHGLVTESTDGKLEIGPTLIHLESSSPHIPRHHQNWRIQAFKHHENPKSNEVFYTAPVTLSEKDAMILRENILKFISDSISIIKDSPSEKLFCINIDWFEV